MCIYELIEETLCRPELGQYQTYGILARNGAESLSIRDVSVSKANVEGLILLLNRNHVPLEHSMDVLNDFIGVRI